jgi:hypothetical protein
MRNTDDNLPNILVRLDIQSRKRNFIGRENERQVEN